MKIGFIAMSGVRAYNKELTELGLTLPGFVERNKVIASLPSLGLLTLAGLTPATFDFAYLEVPDLATVAEVPGEFDVVAISSFSAQIYEAYQLADRYRARGTIVILGGLHSRLDPPRRCNTPTASLSARARLHGRRYPQTSSTAH